VRSRELGILGAASISKAAPLLCAINKKPPDCQEVQTPPDNPAAQYSFEHRGDAVWGEGGAPPL
jgi:hypothetical protein